MGCTGSKEARKRETDDDLVVPSGDEQKQEASTRARRLSLAVEAKTGYVQHEAAAAATTAGAHAEAVVVTRASSSSSNCKQPGTPTQEAASQAGQDSNGSSNNNNNNSAADKPPASPQLHPTRSRRLSHLYTIQQAAKEMAACDGVQTSSEHIQSAWQQAQATAEAQATAAPAPAAQARMQPTVRVQVACMSRAGCEPGYKKTNQDNCFAFEKYITNEQALFGAMDGHGPSGHFVSGFVKKQLPMLLVNHLGKHSVQDALRASFLEVDANLGASSIDCEFSGCTCAVAHLQGNTLTTAWVGDSRMVLGRQKKKGWRSHWEAIDLSTDHKPTQPEERQRILDHRGRVERLVDETGQPIGPHRVWLECAWLPGLAMSRALGDKLAHSVGVSSEPQHTQLQLTPADKLLLLASDGVWEFITSKEAIDLIGDCDTPEEACRLLVDEAYTRWAEEEEGVVDDITAVVVKLIHGQQ